MKIAIVLLMTLSMGCAGMTGGTTSDAWYTKFRDKASCAGLILLINEDPGKLIAGVLADKMHKLGCVNQDPGEPPSAVWKTSPTDPGESAPS